MLGSAAAADVLLMSLYFAALLAAHRSKRLQKTYPAGVEENFAHVAAGGAELLTDLTKDSDKLKIPGWATRTLSLGGAWLLLKASRFLGAVFPVPGALTLLVTVLAVLSGKVLSNLAPQVHDRVVLQAPTLANVLLNMFFAAIGASARLSGVFQAGPAVFCFAAIALLTHAVVILLGTEIASRNLKGGLSLDTVLVASNAAIGGPSTAATFAHTVKRKDLVIPGAVWGTAGYAVATLVGVGVFKLLK